MCCLEDEPKNLGQGLCGEPVRFPSSASSPYPVSDFPLVVYGGDKVRDVRLGERAWDASLPDYFMRWHFDPFPITMGTALDSEYKTGDNTVLLNENVVDQGDEGRAYDSSVVIEKEMEHKEPSAVFMTPTGEGHLFFEGPLDQFLLTFYSEDRSGVLKDGDRSVYRVLQRLEEDMLLSEDDSDIRLPFRTLFDEQSSRIGVAALREIVSNSFDAMGGSIGKFGSGVKQLIGQLKHDGDEIAYRSGLYSLIVRRVNDKNYIYLVAHSEYLQGTEVVIKNSELPSRSECEKELLFRYCTHDRGAVVVNGRRNGRRLYNVHTGKVISPLYDIEVTITDDTWVVRDYGLGMSLHKLCHIFVPSHQSKVPGKDTVPQIYSDKPLDDIMDNTEIVDVFFSRQGEVIYGLDEIELDTKGGATLFVELGKYLSLQESRDFIYLTEPCVEVLYSLLVSVVQDEDQPLKWRLKVVAAIVKKLTEISLKNEYNKGVLLDLEEGLKNILSPYFMRFHEEGGIVLELTFLPLMEKQEENMIVVPGCLMGSDITQLSFCV